MNRWVAATTPLHCKPKENQNEKRKIDPERHTNRGEKKKTIGDHRRRSRRRSDAPVVRRQTVTSSHHRPVDLHLDRRKIWIWKGRRKGGG
jgi:hypothetical protein